MLRIAPSLPPVDAVEVSELTQALVSAVRDVASLAAKPIPVTLVVPTEHCLMLYDSRVAEGFDHSHATALLEQLASIGLRNIVWAKDPVEATREDAKKLASLRKLAGARALSGPESVPASLASVWSEE